MPNVSGPNSTNTPAIIADPPKRRNGNDGDTEALKFKRKIQRRLLAYALNKLILNAIFHTKSGVNGATAEKSRFCD